jgi:hypothetical protein
MITGSIRTRIKPASLPYLGISMMMGSHSSPPHRTGLAIQLKLFFRFLSQLSYGLSRMSMHGIMLSGKREVGLTDLPQMQE